MGNVSLLWIWCIVIPWLTFILHVAAASFLSYTTCTLTLRPPLAVDCPSLVSYSSYVVFTGIVQGIRGNTAYTHLFVSQHSVYPLLHPPDAHAVASYRWTTRWFHPPTYSYGIKPFARPRGVPVHWNGAHLSTVNIHENPLVWSSYIDWQPSSQSQPFDQTQ